MSKVGLVVGIGKGGHPEDQFTPLKPFAEPPPTVRSLIAGAAETTRAPREAKASGVPIASAQQPPGSVVAAAAAFFCAARLPSRGQGEDLDALLASASELKAARLDHILSLLGDFGEIFTEQAGCTRLVQHCIDTSDGQL